MPAAGLVVLYLLAALAPLALAWAQGLPPRPLLDELATGAGMLALVVLLVEFLLSGRFRSVSRGVGMDVTMRAHQLLARAAIAFALLHPFLYTTPMARPLPWDVTRQMTVAHGALEIGTGIVAWVTLLVLVALAIGRRGVPLRYETWRLLHGLMALIVAVAGVTHAVTAGRYSADPLLAGLWGALLAVAVASLLWVYVGRPLRKSRRPWQVARVTPAAERTWELTLAPVGHAGLRYRAGEFVWLNVGNGAFSLKENPFSIASAPASGPEVSFVIKELGDFTRTVGTVAPGTRAWLDGPHGHLTLDGHPRAPGVALIAGGVGIAPMLSILRQMAATGDPRPRTLIYANRSADQIVAGAELERMRADNGLELIHVLGDPPPGWTGRTGLVTPDLLAASFAERRDWLFVLCGPPPMLESVEAALLALGVPPANILGERFDYD